MQIFLHGKIMKAYRLRLNFLRAHYQKKRGTRKKMVLFYVCRLILFSNLFRKQLFFFHVYAAYNNLRQKWLLPAIRERKREQNKKKTFVSFFFLLFRKIFFRIYKLCKSLLIYVILNFWRRCGKCCFKTNINLQC